MKKLNIIIATGLSAIIAFFSDMPAVYTFENEIYLAHPAVADIQLFVIVSNSGIRSQGMREEIVFSGTAVSHLIIDSPRSATF